jgi:hypothetical protein
MGLLRVRYLVLCFFFYIFKIFLKLCQTNLIDFGSLMTRVLSLQILISWHLGNNVNKVFTEINEWFQVSLFSLNYGKTFFLQFFTKKSRQLDTKIHLGNKRITNIHSTKFLGLTMDISLSWKHQIKEFKSKLNKACYAIRSIKPFLSLEVLRMTYFFNVNSILSYGKIFWGNSSYSKTIFKMQKRKIRVVISSGRRDSCHELFTQLNCCSLNIHPL